MKKIFFLIINLFCLQLMVAQEPIRDSNEIEKIVKQKTELAQEAQKKAHQAEQEEQTEKDEAEKYKKKYLDSSLTPIDRKEARVQYIIWDSKAQTSEKTKNQELTKEKDLKDQITQLAQAQAAVEKEFNPDQKKPETDILKEKFEICIKNDILSLFESQKLQNLQTSQLQDYLKELSKIIAEITQYERMHFYQSDRYTDQKWKKIHNDALLNPKNFESRYIVLLTSLMEVKKKIEALLKQNDIDIPTTARTNKCFVDIYKDINEKIIKMEKLIGQSNDSSIIWD